MPGESFIDVDSAQQSKAGQYVTGDVFVCRKIKEEGRVKMLGMSIHDRIMARKLVDEASIGTIEQRHGCASARQPARERRPTRPPRGSQ